MARDPATGISTRLQAALPHRVEPHPQALGQNDKRDNGESGQGANQQRQDQKNLLLALLKKRNPARPQSGAPFFFFLFWLVLEGRRNSHRDSLLAGC